MKEIKQWLMVRFEELFKQLFKIVKEFLPVIVSFGALFLANSTLDFTAKTDIAVEIYIEENMKKLSLEDQGKLVDNILFRREGRSDKLHEFDCENETDKTKTDNNKLCKLDSILERLAQDEKYTQSGVEGILIIIGYILIAAIVITTIGAFIRTFFDWYL